MSTPINLFNVPDYVDLQELDMDGQIVLDKHNPDAGTKYDAGKPLIALIPSAAVLEEAKVMTFGANKYDLHNWRAGLSWLRVISAVLRHIYAWLGGEDQDPETGLHHLAHARAGLGFLIEYQTTHREKDDRR